MSKTKWYQKPIYLLLALALVLSLGVMAAPASGILEASPGGIINGGFESGDLTGWTVGGLGAHVEVLQSSNFVPVITPPEGSYFALLSNGPGEINAVNGTDLDGNGFPDSDTASLSQTFSVSLVPATLSFQWSFLTSEVPEFDDFFMVTLNGVDILHGSVPGALDFVSPFPDVPPLDGNPYNVTSSGVTNGSYFDDGRTAFQSFSYVISTPGSYTLEFLVADQANHVMDTGVLIDDVNLTVGGGPPPNVRYLHSLGGLFNLTDPVGTQWHELWPVFCREYHLSSWNDTSGDGVLSYCDWIDMYEEPDGEVKWYHVEEVTITLLVAPPEDANNENHVTGLPPQGNKVPRQPMYIELEGGYNSSVLTNPVCTQWHEIYPNFCRQYHLSNWEEGPGNGVLDYCDYIFLTPKGAYGPLTCPLDEDFSGSWLPSGWTTDDWYQSDTNHAGGTPPEARLAWYNITGDYAYLDSKPVDTTGAPSLTLEFKSFIDDFCQDGFYNCTVYTRADGGDSWTDVTPWSNPIYGDVGPGTYSVDISSDIGSATQVSFEFDGVGWCLDYWYVDDVKICSPGAWWHVEEVAIDIIVTPEPAPVGGEAYPVNKISLLAPWIAAVVLLAGGISWYVLRRRRAQS